VPEYNFSISSPLKNAYDWLARDDKSGYCPMTNAIGAMVSSGGQGGGSKAQTQFRESVEYRKMQLLEPSSNAEILIKRFFGQFFD
jgi:NAD(P)H-dependent FMN reductase